MKITLGAVIDSMKYIHTLFWYSTLNSYQIDRTFFLYRDDQMLIECSNRIVNHMYSDNHSIAVDWLLHVTSHAEYKYINKYHDILALAFTFFSLGSLCEDWRSRHTPFQKSIYLSSSFEFITWASRRLKLPLAFLRVGGECLATNLHTGARIGH